MTLRLLPLTAAATCSALLLAGLVPAGAASADRLVVDDRFRTTADIGFHDWDRYGNPRELRNDLAGALRGQVELVQSSTVNPAGNAEAELPTLVAERTALLLLSPDVADPLAGSYEVEVRVRGQVRGTLTLAHPNLLPPSDQTYTRETVTYSKRAWSVQLPWQWVRPGLELTFTDASGRTGTLAQVDVAAPTEIVVNNIQLGMLTTAPDSNGHRFIKDPANGATDYFQTLPVSRMVMAKYDKVELDKVIVASGKVYTENSDVNGDVYSGDMRENVGKAQVSTGINLATWGITSSPMNQSQPGVTNQRVIHHSAGEYANGRITHGLSGGNGMATLYDSVGNELSHELGHSYGLGHYPGTDTSKTGDDVIRNASHHMDSGWGWIPYRGVMRSNLNPGAYNPLPTINSFPFSESLVGTYNFNTDTMSGGWDASPVSDYTHVTGWSQRRMQANLSTAVVADLAYPSGYRAWSTAAGEWVDAKVANPAFNRLRPKKVGVGVFTLLGGYNPADPAQTVLYPAFRSNWGTTFDLPQATTTGTSSTRACWLRVDFASAPTQYVALDASPGVKQLNVNVAQDERPTGARVACRVDGTTTPMGDPITIATDLPPMEPAVVVGQEAGFETLRAQELAALDPVLAEQVDRTVPSISSAQELVLRGWSDDLSALSRDARTVADRILDARQQASDLAAYLAQQRDELASDDGTRRAELVDWMRRRGYATPGETLLPAGTTVTVDGGKCLTLDEDDAGAPFVRTTARAADCTGDDTEKWWVDAAGRIHAATRPDLCVRAATPVQAVPCSTTDAEQRWVFEDDGHVRRSANAGSYLDLYRHNNLPGLYGRGAGGNQLWTGFTTSANTLLAHLSGSELAGLREVAGFPGVDLVATTPVRQGWLKAPTSVRAVALDQVTGAPLDAEVDLGDGWQPYTGPVALPAGVTEVAARAATDGGASSTVRQTFRVDATAPRTTATLDAQALTLAATDEGSGVERVEYRLPGGAWTTYEAPVVLADPAGVTSRPVEFRAVDVVGNVEKARSVQASSRRVTVIATPLAGRTGESVTSTVTVRAADGGTDVPTGVVRLVLGGQVFASGHLVDGVATVRQTVTQPGGDHELEVRYSGDARFAAGRSATTLRVPTAPGTAPTAAPTPTPSVRPSPGPSASPSPTPAGPTAAPQPTPTVGTGAVKLKVSLPSVRHGQGLGARVTVTAKKKGAGVPQGEVRVLRGTKVLDTAPVVGGVAHVASSTRLKAGRHQLAFVYSGDARFASNSTTAMLRVTKARAKVSVKVRKKAKLSVRAGSKKLVARARVRTAKGVKPTGSVRFAFVRVTNGKATVVARTKAPLKSGLAKVRVPRKVRTQPGTYRVRATYVGSKNVGRAKATKKKQARLTVR